MSLFNWPFKRKVYAGIENPRYVSDIQAANEAVLDGIAAVTGLNGTDFAIISGLDFTPGPPTGSYAPGVIYFNGTFYLVQTGFNENLYLTPNNTDVLSVGFTDGNARNIYTEQYAVSTAVSTGNTPQFTGDMDQYRLGLKFTKSEIITLQTIAANLGNSATRNVGTTAGTVAAGDDTRLVYTQTQFNTLFSGKSPSIKGEIKQIYDFDSTFAANFDGTGVGITAPWVGWALMDGQGGRPDMTGTMLVGVGTGYVSKIPGGNNSVTLTANNIPPLATSPDFSVTGGGGLQAYTAPSSSASKGSIPVNGSSPTTPVNVQNKYIPVYMVVRIV